jgi:hypothetical protein
MTAFQIGFLFIPRPAWAIVFLFVFPGIAEMTGLCHPAELLLEIVSCEHFVAQAGHMVHLISTSQDVRIRGLNYCE